MRIGVLGTGMAGRAVAAKLVELGHQVLVGTRDPAATLAREEPHPVTGIPPFRAWPDQHPGIKLGGFADARGAEMLLPIWLRLWGALQTPMLNFKVVR